MIFFANYFFPCWPVLVLQNHGEEISLRLRTDDLKGFRKYESIKKTLLHELVSLIIFLLFLLLLIHAFLSVNKIVGLMLFFCSYQAHMVFSEHDVNFYALDKQVTRYANLVFLNKSISLLIYSIYLEGSSLM